MIKVGKNLLGPGDVAGSALDQDGVRPEVDIDVETILHDLKVFVMSSKKFFDVWNKIYVLLHLIRPFPPQAGDAHQCPPMEVHRNCLGVQKRCCSPTRAWKQYHCWR